MGAILLEIINNRVIQAAALAWAIAQGIKVLLTLAISALTNPLADLAKRQLPGLRGSEAHFSVIISEEDLKIFKRLGVRVSCEPKYETKRLYHR